MLSSETRLDAMEQRLAKFYLRQLRRIWIRLPVALQRARLGRAFGRHVDRIVRLYSERNQHFATFFLRNRPELELLLRLASQTPQSGSLRMTILACSKGAEAYSMAWTIRSARPDINLRICAIDISHEIVEFAERGVYSMRKPEPQDLSTEEVVRQNKNLASIPSSDRFAWIFEGISQAEIESMFDVRGQEATVKQWLREGITWQTGDAGDPALAAAIGQQDIVVANRFLCHMLPKDAEKCLRNVDRLVRPGGYLLVCGVDLDVRTRIALERNWSPVTELIREIHASDDLGPAWPVDYWGLEPLDDRRPDWQVRYATAFRIGAPSAPSDELSRSGKRQYDEIAIESDS